LTGSVVNGRLILTGKSTGSAENYTLSMSSGPATLTDFGLQASVSDVAAQDAQITLAGITVNSSTNVFNNAINGVSITAVALGTGKNLSVTSDTASAVNKVQDMVTKVNDIISQIQEDTKYDVATKQGGPLLGDSFVTSIATQLTRQVTDTFDPNVGGNSGYENYTKIGLSVGRDGKLSLDTAKLRTALDANPSAVYNLFAREDGATSGSTKLNSAGNTTTMAQGDGIANRLSAFADMLISRSSAYNGLDANGARATGAMVSRIDAMNQTISNFDKRVATLEDRVARREKIVRNQFLAMEKAISMIRSQGQAMSAQIGMG
jgi:flagellar hook-associated protein 2